MLQSRCVLAALLTLGMIVGWGMTQSAEKTTEAPKKIDAPAKKPAEPDTFKEDQRIVYQAGLKGDGADLLEYFRKRTLKQPDPKEIAALVKQLGDDDFTIAKRRSRRWSPWARARWRD